MMAEDKKRSCYCGGVLAIIIAVLVLLDMHGLSFVKDKIWDEIVILVLAILIAVGSFAGCCCSKFCKPKEGA